MSTDTQAGSPMTDRPEEVDMRWRKKPVVVEAMQLPAIGDDPSRELIEWLHTQNREWESGRDGTLVIHTLEGDMTAQPCDWIIRGVSGEIYPCKPDIFAKTYEPAALTGARGEPSEQRDPDGFIAISEIDELFGTGGATITRAKESHDDLCVTIHSLSTPTEPSTEPTYIEPEQACPPTKVCVKWGCEKVELVKDGKYYICPTCRSSYGECPHPDFAEHAEKPPHPVDWAAYNEWVAERAPSERLFTQAEVDDAVDRAWQEGHDRGACRCKVTSLLAAVDCPVHSPEYGEPSEAEPDGWVWRVKRDDGATPTTESGDE